MDAIDAVCPGFSNGLQSGPNYSVPRQGRVAVWELCLDVESDSIRAVFSADFRCISGRADSSHRQKAQMGVFTLLSHDVHIDLESFLLSKDLGGLLSKYTVPASETPKALYCLNLMNINPASMFPDLIGAAAMANVSWPLATFWEPLSAASPSE